MKERKRRSKGGKARGRSEEPSEDRIEDRMEEGTGREEENVKKVG